MQTFSDMQRSISNQNSLTPFLYVVLFIVYTALSGIYLFFPPLLSVVFIFFSKSLKEEKTLNMILILLCLLFFEAQNGYLLFSTIIFFALIYKYIVPKIKQNFSCNSCVKLSIVILIYLGFYIFNLFLSNVFLVEVPTINYYVIYYIMVEFIILSLLFK